MPKRVSPKRVSYKVGLPARQKAISDVEKIATVIPPAPTRESNRTRDVREYMRNTHLPGALIELTRLLQDPDAKVRMAAVRLTVEHTIGKPPSIVTLNDTTTDSPEHYARIWEQELASGRIKLIPVRVEELPPTLPRTDSTTLPAVVHTTIPKDATEAEYRDA